MARKNTKFKSTNRNFRITIELLKIAEEQIQLQ